MKTYYPLQILLTSLITLLATASLAQTTDFKSDYKLGVVISVDQFRADYLMRFKNKFKGGYKMLLEKSAYLPLADHGLLQNMTGPGHAAILTGSYPYRITFPSIPGLIAKPEKKGIVFKTTLLKLSVPRGF